MGDGESHAMRLCTSDVTPVITRPGLETGRCQMVATVAADTISPALLYNSRASPIRRAFALYLLCNLHTAHFGGPFGCGCGLATGKKLGRTRFAWDVPAGWAVPVRTGTTDLSNVPVRTGTAQPAGLSQLGLGCPT